jgi:hypothetical protein
MHVEAAIAHLLELLDLPAKFVGIELVVPRPERRGTILTAGIFEKFGSERLIFLRVQYGNRLLLILFD